jgi:hypothetical protein
MGHRALIAYERPDSLYNVHYSHWGAPNLQLRHQITPETPFGSDDPPEAVQNLFTDLLTVETKDEAAALIEPEDELLAPIEFEPWAVAVTFDDLLACELDYLHHEACYVVDRSLEATAYHALVRPAVPLPVDQLVADGRQRRDPDRALA